MLDEPIGWSFFIVGFIAAGLAIFLPFFYFLSSWIAGKFLRANGYHLAIYMSTAFFLASFGEPLADLIYLSLFGELLWIYQLMPILHGASSAIGFLTWPFYGYYAYFFHQAISARKIVFPNWLKALIPAIDGIPFDMLGNGFALWLFGFILFYYPRPELWHLSAWPVIPIYLIYGLLFMLSVNYLLKRPKHWSIPITIYLSGCLVMILGELGPLFF